MAHFFYTSFEGTYFYTVFRREKKNRCVCNKAYLLLLLGDGKYSALKSTDGAGPTDSPGASTGVVAAAIVMGVLNVILISVLVILFLRHKNIIPHVKDGKSSFF